MKITYKFHGIVLRVKCNDPQETHIGLIQHQLHIVDYNYDLNDDFPREHNILWTTSAFTDLFH